MKVNEKTIKTIEVEEVVELIDEETTRGIIVLPENKIAILRYKGQSVGHIPASRGFAVTLEISGDTLRVYKDCLIIVSFSKVDEIEISTYKR